MESITDIRENQLVVGLGREQAFEIQPCGAKSNNELEALAAVRRG